MGRGKRIDYPGAWHHVMHRGARQEPIFADDADCLCFLETIEEAVADYALEVHAYALMPNHYHLLVRSPEGTLSRGMQYLNSRFTRRVNRRHDWDGPLFRGRFRSQLVDSERYLRFLVAYIHLNPVRAHLVQRPDAPCWTSHRALAGLEPPPPWLEVDRLRRLLGTAEAIDDFVRAVHQGAEPWPEDLELEDGWVRASEDTPTPEPPPKPDAAHSGQATPEELLERLQSVTGASLKELRTARRGRGANTARRFAVVTLARQPGMRHRDVGGLLHMSVQQVGNVLYRHRARPVPEVFETWRQRWEAEAGGSKSEK